MSFARTGQVVWAGRAHTLATGALGLDSPVLSDLVGTPLDGLLGGDVLGSSPFTVDLECGACFFGETPTDRDGIELHLRVVLEYLSQALHSTACLPPHASTRERSSYPSVAGWAGKKVVDEADDFTPGSAHSVPPSTRYQFESAFPY